MTPALLQVQEYREKTVQCLRAGNYTKPGKYTIETLLLYFMTEHHHHTDAQFGNWILMGEISRIAMRLGLHRDPSHTPNFTPFEGEMRRRLWSAIQQTDITTSSQMGLPRIIRESYCDTKELLNLIDEDLDDNMVESPKARPESFITPALYIRTRNRLLNVFAKVSDMTASVKASSYSDIWNLDKELVEAHSNIPQGLKLPPHAPRVAEGHVILINRIYLDAAYQHARCVLHRPYLIPARANSLYSSSRKACLDAALAILHHQHMLHLETLPGGQFELYRWKLSSFWNHGMLLAVTILCVDLNKDFEDGLMGENYLLQDGRRELTDALRNAQQVLLQSWNISADARKGVTAITLVLSKAGLVTDLMPSPVVDMSNTAHQYHFPSQTPVWSMGEFLGSEFPHFNSWVNLVSAGL